MQVLLYRLLAVLDTVDSLVRFDMFIASTLRISVDLTALAN